MPNQKDKPKKRRKITYDKSDFRMDASSKNDNGAGRAFTESGSLRENAVPTKMVEDSFVSQNMTQRNVGEREFYGRETANSFTAKKRNKRNQKKDSKPDDNLSQSMPEKTKHKRSQYKMAENSALAEFKKDGFKEKDFRTKDIDYDDLKSMFSESKKESRSTSKENAKRTARKKASAEYASKKGDYVVEKVFDEKTGTSKYVVMSAGQEKKAKKKYNAKRKMYQQAVKDKDKYVSNREENTDDNAAVDAAKATENRVEDMVYGVVDYRKNAPYRQYNRKQKEAEKLNKELKKEDTLKLNKMTEVKYQEFLAKNPELRDEKSLKAMYQKKAQKARIKKEYAKALRKEKAGKAAKEAVKETQKTTVTIAKKAQELIAKNASTIIYIGIGLLLVLLIASMFSSCGAMFSQGLSGITTSSYTSEPAEIDSADLVMTGMEMELQNEIDAIETTYPGYDEYRYNLAEIGHDPFILISFLSAKYGQFTAASVQSDVEALFNAMYTLTTEEVTETRTRTETRTGTRTVENEDGTTSEEEYEYEVEVEYEVTILEVKLIATSLDTLVRGQLDTDQVALYEGYLGSKGMIQYFYSPLDLYWYNYISSYYGYRKHPSTGVEQFHRGVDIAVPEGTPVYAGHDGTVTTATYDSSYGNYVVITDSQGYVSKYAHLSSLSVSQGQSITHGTQIGATGNTGQSTGSHLHLECLYNGEYYNPLFYFLAGENTLYGEQPGAGGPGNSNVIPPDSYDDATVQKLFNEATKYIGMPYTFGGTAPTSFDCSGFVCWSFSNSGVHNLPRTTAQGIYDQCAPVSAGSAKAGDLIFFQGTYNTGDGRVVTHVGIYCGDGVMLHCGDPIGYANINSSYWQSHYYSFGRLIN